ncbi:MAG: M23 family metallopeptidase [Anaerolineaceae bacterium]|nr:M23 family metallopeptidase [Anaerolineaceae bacterium]
MASDLNQLIQNLRSSFPAEEVSFSFPLPQPFPVSQRFGENPQWYKRFGIATGHNGIDYAAPARTPVLASAGGIVIKTGFDPEGYGNYIKIAHGSNYVSLYAHLEEIQVRNTQLVESGRQIGLSGSTGFSTGPHLHFEIRDKDNAAIDPEPLLLPVISNPPQEGEKSNLQSTVAPMVARVAVPLLNIRSAPSINAPVIGQLAQDQRITILERFTTVWVQIGEVPDGTVRGGNAFVAHTFENNPYLTEVQP